MGLEMTSSTSKNTLKIKKPHFLTKKHLCYAILVSIPIIYIICVYRSSMFKSTTLSQRFNIESIVVSITPSNESSSSSSSLVTPITAANDSSSTVAPKDDQEEHVKLLNQCDYSYGKWIPSDLEPLYNDVSCEAIKNEQKCLSNGRPDSGYLYWRWKPSGDDCELPRFDPEAFLTLMRDKHLAFVGDSIARNQAESLVCMLSSLYHPIITHSRSHDKRKVHDSGLHGRWHFSSHNVNISLYWSPYLLKGTMTDNRTIYIDMIDETWASDMGMFDALVLSIGNWFHWSVVIYEGGLVVGCYSCDDPDIHTRIDVNVAFTKVLRNAFKAILDRQMKASDDDHARHHRNSSSLDVILTTYSPNHFEGVWYLGDGCPKTEPYEESKEMETLFKQMREIGVEAVDEARSNIMKMGIEEKVRITTLDITKLSWLRPDGHPGIYVHPLSIASKNVEGTLTPQDCLHWCLPGAIDTWNEIMFEIIKNWQI